MEILVEEVVSSSKRAREGDVVGDCTHSTEEDVVGPASKKLCIEEAALCPTPSVLELEDLELPRADDESIGCSSDGSCVLNRSEEVAGCVAGGKLSDNLLVAHHIDVDALFRGATPQHEQHLQGSSECSAISKEDADRVLRSLEEELGVSSESDDYASSISSVPSSAQEALVDAALSSWSEEIWNSNEFVTTSEDGCVTASFSSGSSFAGEDDHGSATGSKASDHFCALSSNFEPVDNSAQIDIVFLKEASDDELGIPPSPKTERVFDDGMEKQVHETSMRALSEAGALLEADHSCIVDDETGPRTPESQLHEAVSWVLQENSVDLPPFNDMAAEESDSDWLMPVSGSLDFLLDFSTGSYVPVAT